MGEKDLSRPLERIRHEGPVSFVPPSRRHRHIRNERVLSWVCRVKGEHAVKKLDMAKKKRVTDDGAQGKSPPMQPPKRQIEVRNQECAQWLPKGIQAPRGFYAMTDRWSRLKELINVHSLGGLADPGYVEWELVVPDDDIVAVWDGLALDGATMAFVHANKEALAGRVNPVYAESSGGGHLGRYMGSMGSEMRRAKALVAQVHGFLNRVPCSRCEVRYRENYIRVTDDPLPDQDTTASGPSGPPKDYTRHLMVPWYGCISLPGFAKDACANCLYHIEGNKCNFAQPEAEQKDSWRRLKATTEDKGQRKLRPETAERIAEMPSELTAEEEKRLEADQRTTASSRPQRR